MFKKTIGNGVKGAFTLAEVLITLGIIGVVAAMTMPTLINSTQGAQYKTAYKKALSVMSQAVVMNIALDDYDLSQTVAGTKNGSDADGVQSVYSLFKNRMNVVKVAKGSDFEAAIDLHDTSGSKNYTIVSVPEESANDYTAFATLHSPTAKNTFPAIIQGKTWPEETTLLFFNDGITFIFDNRSAACAAATAADGSEDAYCYGFIDINGQKAPNKVVTCDNNTISGSGTDAAACTVTNPTDIYPIAFYDQSVVPASAAARAVLYAK